MTADAMLDLLRSVKYRDQFVPNDVSLVVDESDEATIVTAVMFPSGQTERYTAFVSHLIAIREPGDSPYRPLDHVAEDLRKSIIFLAYACIDAGR